VKYEKKNLVPIEIFKEIEAIRIKPKENNNESLTFLKSSEIMSLQNPQLKALKAEYAIYQKIADIQTPLPNPNLELGPNLSSPFGNISKSVVPFVALGFTIPLGGKLKKNDSVNKAKALRSLVETQVQHRKLYFELRESFVSIITVGKKKFLQDDMIASASLTLKTLEHLRNAGGIDLLDIGIIELNNLQTKTYKFELENEYQEELAKFSMLLGIDNSLVENIKPSELPSKKTILPNYEKIKEIMITNHFALATLRYDYEIAEKSLQLEISKQYPDITWGGSYEQELGDKSKVIGLRLGINLPIFDRNQHGISRAFKERDHIRSVYEQTIFEALSLLKKNYNQLIVQIEKHCYIQDVILKKAEQNLMIVEKNLKIGAIDIVKYLEVLRTFQEVSTNVLNSEADLLKTWVKIEETIGFPLLEFPNEEKFNLPLNNLELEEVKSK
jgi:outer membrane protein TolC